MPAETSVLAKLIAVIPETPNIQTLRLERPFDFKAGQAVQVTLPGDSKKRFYSISSSPTEADRLDLTIKAELGSPLYASLFRLKEGTPIELFGPMGKFFLPEDQPGPFYFLAAGTGVAPFRSMIKWLLDKKPEVESWLFHSARTPEDLIFREEFLQWGADKARFHYVPTFTQFSGIDPEKETGRIGELMLRKHLPDPSGIFLLCGPTAFVKDLELLLQATMHISADRIRREQW